MIQVHTEKKRWKQQEYYLHTQESTRQIAWQESTLKPINLKIPNVP